MTFKNLLGTTVLIGLLALILVTCAPTPIVQPTPPAGEGLSTGLVNSMNDIIAEGIWALLFRGLFVVGGLSMIIQALRGKARFGDVDHPIEGELTEPWQRNLWGLAGVALIALAAGLFEWTCWSFLIGILIPFGVYIIVGSAAGSQG